MNMIDGVGQIDVQTVIKISSVMDEIKVLKQKDCAERILGCRKWGEVGRKVRRLLFLFKVTKRDNKYLLKGSERWFWKFQPFESQDSIMTVTLDFVYRWF